MVREFQNESASQDNASAKNYRFDTARRASHRSGSAEVPVLFRLQNLQRNPDVSPASSTNASVSLNSTSQNAATGAGKTSPSLSREAPPQSQQSLESKTRVPDSSVPKLDPTEPTTQQASPAVISNRPWSTNVILLTIGVAVVFLLLKSNPSQPSLASSKANLAVSEKSLKPLVASTSRTNSESPIETPSTADSKLVSSILDIPKDDRFGSIEPLVAPKLPAPMELVTEQPSSVMPVFTPLIQQTADSATSKNASKPSEDVASISMDLPADYSPYATLDGRSSDSSESHRSVMIPSDAMVVEGARSNDSNRASTISRFPGNESVLYRQPTPTIVTNPHVASATSAQSTESPGKQGEGDQGSAQQSQLVTTTSPDLETAELFKLRERYLRANMESQQQAIVGNRQPMAGATVQPWTNNSSNGVPPITVVSGPTQPGPTYVPPAFVQRPTYQQQPVQAASPGYGRIGLNGQAANTPNLATTPSNQPYVPIVGAFTPDGFVEATDYATQPQPQVPTSGGYQPLSPQFQSQPMNGN